MERRYGVLRFISVVYKILGILAAALTVGLIVLVIVGTVLGPDAIGLPLMWYRRMPVRAARSTAINVVAILLYGGGLSLSLFAVGQVIDLFISMEAHSRQTAHLLADLLEARRAPRPAAPPPPPPGTGYTPDVETNDAPPEG